MQNAELKACGCMIDLAEPICESSDQNLNVLVIDHSPAMRAVLGTMVSTIAGARIVTCGSPDDAFWRCSAFLFDVVIIDHHVPDINGVALLQRLRQLERYGAVPMIMLTSERGQGLRLAALSAGVNDFVTKPFDFPELKARVTNMLALRRAQKQKSELPSFLAEDVDAGLREIASRKQEVIWRLALAIEARDGGTGAHVSRVARISQRLAQAMGLGEARSRLIYLAAPLHDVGKIATPDAILAKSGPLTAAEQAIMRQHVQHGVSILRDGATDLMKVAAIIARGHHEKWDGTGYPAGLVGEAIPIEARIVAVADVFDTLCSARAYKKAFPFEAAFAEIIASAGAHFDPACVEAFEQLEDELRRMYSTDFGCCITSAPFADAIEFSA